jgi:hypothetical protein
MFFANVRNTIEKVIEVFHHEEGAILANAKDM